MDSSSKSTRGDNCGKCAMHGSDNTDDANAEGESNSMDFITDEEKEEFVDQHNLYRCMHGAPPLEWNDVM
jgi:uncharacterized protein YkwD